MSPLSFPTKFAKGDKSNNSVIGLIPFTLILPGPYPLFADQTERRATKTENGAGSESADGLTATESLPESFGKHYDQGRRRVG
jgi:hypothetical protein